MKNDPYLLTELIRNDDFIRWVRNPTEDSNRRWEEIISALPRKKAVFESARQYVNIIADDTGKHLPTVNQSEKMWQAVKDGIRNKNETWSNEKDYR